MNFSRLITGLILIVGGFALIVVSFLTSFFILIYGIPILLIGFWIWFNKNEDKIEERLDESKGLNKRKSKKK